MKNLLERFVLRRVAERTLQQIEVMDKEKILEALSAIPENGVKAILSVAAGREQEARENCAFRNQSADDLRFNSGKLADAVEFQEDLIALIKRAQERKQLN